MRPKTKVQKISSAPTTKTAYGMPAIGKVGDPAAVWLEQRGQREGDDGAGRRTAATSEVGGGLQVLRRRAAAARTAGRRTAASSSTTRIQPIATGIDLMVIAAEHLVADRHRAAEADQLEDHALEAQEERQRDHERRDAELGDQQPDRQADQGADGQADQHRDRPGWPLRSIATAVNRPPCRR